ncbi:glycosyltransferase family 4 protein [Nostoc sp.]|uniref:glycosyltransferase family 4 protein n=1 Tax=Nostoc sp. TaxID=1180 RepID=UPI002FF87906
MNSLNILHINNWFGLGGAFIAAYNLHQGLSRANIQSFFAYKDEIDGVFQEKTNDLKNTVQIVQRKNQFVDLANSITRRIGLNYVANPSIAALKHQACYQNAALLNFHLLHDDYFSYLMLPSLTRDKPAVYTLHDMWSFTGHCAYSYDCSKWQTGCGKCPYPNALPPIQRDATSLEWKLKNWAYQHSNLTIVAPSRWLAECAKQSMLNCFPTHHISNGIDTVAYQPLDQQQCQSELRIPQHKKVLIFGAQDMTNRRKGGDLLLKALSRIPKSLKAETVLLTFGDEAKAISNAAEMEVLHLGYISSDRLKAIAYSAADLFLFPTRADNSPLVLLESMACATPMVSFKVGGVPDYVRPNITGYLAKPEDADDFCNGIVQLLEDINLSDRMNQNCRKVAVEEYSLEVQAQRYIQLYQQILNL